jgi:formiminoglutamate deiminase
VSALWCEHAWLGGQTVDRGVVVDIDGGRIRAVTRSADPPPGAEQVRGLTLPGLANAHSHAFQRKLRGRTQRRRGSFWTWREAMYAGAGELTPEGYLGLATATFGEMALAGITLVGEFHYVHHGPDGTPYADPNAMGEAVIEAAAAAGVRLTLLDTCYLHGGHEEPVEGFQRRFADADVDAWVERVATLDSTATTHIAAAAHSVRALRPEELKQVAAWARERNTPLHAHVSEQRLENEQCLAAHGRTPVELLADTGCLDTSFTAVHTTHLTDNDRRLLASSGTTSCFCPTTERDLADGIGAASRLAEDGARLALGTDSNAVIDIFEEARAMELDERLATERRVNQEPAALLQAATAGGYAALGWGGGEIESGACADLCVVDLGSVRMAGARGDDLVDAVVFAGTAADVRDVMVDGRWIVRGGEHASVDVVGLLERVVR